MTCSLGFCAIRLAQGSWRDAAAVYPGPRLSSLEPVDRPGSPAKAPPAFGHLT